MATTSTAEIFGGNSSANLEEFVQLTGELSEASRSLLSASNNWTYVDTTLRDTAAQLRDCLAVHGSASEADAATGVHHDAWNPAVATRCASTANAVATDLSQAARSYSEMSDLVARAHSLYSTADNAMSSIMTGIIGSVSAALPLKILAGATALFGGAAWVAGGNGRFKTLGAQALHATDGVQEGILTGFANGLLGATSAFNGGVQSGAPVSKAARLIAKVEAPLEALFFGDRLVVTQPHPQTAPIAASATIDDALANLDALNAPNNGLDYGTVAVQKYVDAQGASRWLVLIPGTDTHADTAIGWGQNIELMSSDNEQRLHADSSRLVMEAMERSGIGKDEPVTLVGHSQGGIVAASLAAGLADKYTISHVVTAGSPIANHPIPEKTWVTSIENKGELVSNLDGSRNPDRPTWLTVRGTINPADSNALESSGPLARASATGVANAPEHADITHAMNYQRATWTNAESLGSPALTEHDKHFQEQIKGTLKTTSYYTGRMEH